MQYYKGNALQGTPEIPEEKAAHDPSFFQRIGKVLVFPFVLIFWIFQDLIHKSLEGPD